MKYVRPAFLPAILLAATSVPALAYRLTTPRAAPAALGTGTVGVTAVPACDAGEHVEPSFPPAPAMAVPPGRGTESQ